MPCLECAAPLTASKRGMPKRFCSTECSRTFNNRRATRGAVLYDLFRAMRRDRQAAKDHNVWSEMCRIELAWNDRDEGRKTYKPARMALADVAAQDLVPTTNLYLERKRA